MVSDKKKVESGRLVGLALWLATRLTNTIGVRAEVPCQLQGSDKCRQESKDLTMLRLLCRCYKPLEPERLGYLMVRFSFEVNIIQADGVGTVCKYHQLFRQAQRFLAVAQQ